MKSGIWKKFQTLHMNPLSTPQGHKVAHVLLLSLNPMGSKLSLLLLYRQPFSRYGTILTNFHIFAWNLEFEERSQSCTCTLFLPQGVEIKLICAPRGAIFKIWADFQNFHIWAWYVEFDDRSQSCICTLFPPHGFEIKLIFALRAAVFKIRADFQISIFGHKIQHLKTGPEVVYVPFSYPMGS